MKHFWSFVLFACIAISKFLFLTCLVSLISVYNTVNSVWCLIFQMCQLNCKFNQKLFSIFVSYVLRGASDYFGYPCNLCGRQYNTTSGLRRHKIYNCPYNTEKAPIMLCTYCNYSSRRPDMMRSHIRRHKLNDLANKSAHKYKLVSK